MYHFTPENTTSAVKLPPGIGILQTYFVVSLLCLVRSSLTWLIPGCLLLSLVGAGADVGWSEQKCSLTRRLKVSSQECYCVPCLLAFSNTQCKPKGFEVYLQEKTCFLCRQNLVWGAELVRWGASRSPAAGTWLQGNKGNAHG